MLISKEEFCKKMNQYGVNVDCEKTICINMGGGKFAENGESIGTLGIGKCVTLIAYCNDFSYVAHVDLGNMIGINFDKNGNSIRLKELYRRILEYKKSGGKTLYFGTVSSESFIFEKKWWIKEEILFENQIDSFVELCSSLEFDIIRLPHIQSKFVLIDSNNGNYYVDSYGYCVEKNFNDLTKQKFLGSTENSIHRRIFS